MSNENKRFATARVWWQKTYNDHKNYFMRSNPFVMSEARRTEWESIYNAFSIRPASYPKLIDFGCGAGHFALNFVKQGFEVTGIDALAEALAITKERARRYRLLHRLHLVHNDLHSPMKALDGKFDAGYMIVTYHCIPAPLQKKIFHNFARLIKKRGKILLMEPNPLNLLFYFFYVLYYRTGNIQEGFNIIRSRKDLLIRLLEEEGLGDIRVFRHSFLPTSWINRWRYIRAINGALCRIPLVRNFCAFHIITAVKQR